MRKSNFKTHLFSLILLVVCCVSCQNSSTYVVKNDGVLTLDYNSARSDSLTIKLSDLTKEINYVQLDTTNGSYAEKVSFITENYIIAISKKYLAMLFDKKSGKFITKIGDIGRGYGEYTSAAAIYASEESKEIYISTRERILVYGLDGKFIYEIPLSYKNTVSVLEFIVDSKSKRVIGSARSWNNKESCASVWVQDFDGNLIDTINLHIEALEEGTLQKIGGDLLLHRINLHNVPDTLYRYEVEKSHLTPLFTAIIDDAPILESMSNDSRSIRYFDLGEYYLCKVSSAKIAKNKSEIVVGISYTDENYVIVNKNNLKAGSPNFKNDFTYIEDEQLFDWIGYYGKTSGYASICYEAIILAEKLEESIGVLNRKNDKKAIEFIEDIISNIDEDGNIVVLYGEYK